MNEKMVGDKALYSLAIIYLDNQMLLLEKFEKRYEKADFILNYVLSQNSQTEDMKDLLNDYAFTTYASCSRSLKRSRRDIEKDKNRLAEFLINNSKENREFTFKYNTIISMIEFYESELDERIKKCFEFNTRLIEDNQDLSV